MKTVLWQLYLRHPGHGEAWGVFYRHKPKQGVDMVIGKIIQLSPIQVNVKYPDGIVKEMRMYALDEAGNIWLGEPIDEDDSDFAWTPVETPSKKNILYDIQQLDPIDTTISINEHSDCQ
jgi:hypothetical protein